jgi:hypothetical protein
VRSSSRSRSMTPFSRTCGPRQHRAPPRTNRSLPRSRTRRTVSTSSRPGETARQRRLRSCRERAIHLRQACQPRSSAYDMACRTGRPFVSGRGPPPACSHVTCGAVPPDCSAGQRPGPGGPLRCVQFPETTGQGRSCDGGTVGDFGAVDGAEFGEAGEFRLVEAHRLRGPRRYLVAWCRAVQVQQRCPFAPRHNGGRDASWPPARPTRAPPTTRWPPSPRRAKQVSSPHTQLPRCAPWISRSPTGW